ncbi:hypothetical protein WJX81_002265 [Elliptochloris bilobata]|uniref:Oxidized purine nucleoside triphosphate hydrolase n=1 Tax=Elliptochloris bilobata TaxID=381761 RepID=A0AAW1S9H3_9CHLO
MALPDCLQPKLFTLVLVTDGRRVLLGKKKRGFGEGYFNGFGGKVEAGETIRDAASRELLEEAGIAADSLTHRGTLTFLFDDRPQPWEVHVFHSDSYTGMPTESEEMAPQWFDYDSIPYQQMWADDVFWYPLLLKGSACFRGTFHFVNTHTLVKRDLSEVPCLDGVDYKLC